MSGIQENQMSEFAPNAIVFTGIELKKQKKREYDKNYVLAHREERNERSKKHYYEHKEARRDYNKKYHLKHRDGDLIYAKKYNLEHKEEIKKHQKEHYIKHREEILTHQKEYHSLFNGKYKDYNKRYNKTPAGKMGIARRDAKRRRSLEWDTLNTWFDGSEGHHIGKQYVIYIPKELHQRIRHSLLKNRNMREINTAALDYFFTSATI